MTTDGADARPRRLTRRHWLAGCALTTLAACAGGPRAGRDRIVDVVSGREAMPDEVRRRVDASDAALLGEVHDNPRHHARRADLLRSVPAPATVVLEILPRGAALELPRSTTAAERLRALQRAGFDARGWGWPLHEPLIDAIVESGHRMRGGNLPHPLARRIAREGPPALPPDLRAALDAQPLAADARAALMQDLVDDHCGLIGPERLGGMLWAQRGRDASMALTMAEAIDAALPHRPVVLLAGNGHVRRDYGVPALLAGLRPGRRLLSIAFAETDTTSEVGDATANAPYDVVWFTAPAARDDPCAAMRGAASAPG